MHTALKHGLTIKYKKEQAQTPKTDKDGTKFTQQVLGTFLYYARAVDPTMMVLMPEKA